MKVILKIKMQIVIDSKPKKKRIMTFTRENRSKILAQIVIKTLISPNLFIKKNIINVIGDVKEMIMIRKKNSIAMIVKMNV